MRKMFWALLAMWALPVAAAEISVVSGNGARAAVIELAREFERASGHKVTLHFAVNPEVKRDVDAGRPFDVAILNPPFLDALIREGKVVKQTRTVLGRAGIGVGIREGAPKPDISTVEGFKRALLAAKAVAYPGEGASGKYFVSVIQRLGMMAEMKPKLRPMPAEYNVEVVASGEADMVVVVASRISGVPGVQLVGRIPEELQTWIGFTAGLSANAKEPEAARALLASFTTASAEEILKKTGIQPFVEDFALSRPVELVVHSAAGGGSDVFARELIRMVEAEKLSPQPLRILNKTVGQSAESMAYLAAKKGDDHTIAVFTNTWIATPLTRKDAAHSVKDFTPLVRLVLEPTIAVVRADAPWRNMNDFIAAAKKDPGALKQAGGSPTAIESLTGLLLQSATGAKWTFIQTPAVSDRLANLAAGKVDIVIPQPQDANAYVAAGKARVIAALTEKRLSILPDVPTIREQGISMPIIANARGILGPPDMPRAAALYWEDFFLRLSRTASWKKYLQENHVEDVFLRGAALTPWFDEQIDATRNTLRTAGVTVAR